MKHSQRDTVHRVRAVRSWLEKVGHVLKRLPEKEQAVVEGVYLNDVEQKHLAKSLDISLPYVYRLQKRGIRRVRGMLSRFIHENRQ